jgi:hypothetical protein
MDNKISLSYAALQYACQYQARGQSGRLSYHVHIPPPRLPREGNVPSLVSQLTFIWILFAIMRFCYGIGTYDGMI